MENRHKSLAHAIDAVIAPKILEFAREEGEIFGIVSVNKVQLSKDGAYADVFVMSREKSELLPKFLASRAPMLKRELASKSGMRKLPILRFRVGTGTDESDHVV